LKKTIFIFIFSLSKIFSQNPLLVTLQKVDVTCFKGYASITITNGVSPYTILWSTGSTTLSANNLVVGSYSVNVKDASLKDTIIFFDISDDGCKVEISNHFTPNGDGFNDFWSISNISFYPDFELIIFNRWGQVLFQQTQEYIPWNGTYLGLPLPDGTYYYVFYFDKNNKHKFLKGDVSILR
jgi:gliding motility-associated-like protein